MFNGHGPWLGEWLAEAQGLRGSARQGKGAQCGCPKGTPVAGANQAMGQYDRFAPCCFAARGIFELMDNGMNLPAQTPSQEDVGAPL